MAKIQIETSKDGKTYLDQIEDTDIDATKQKLEGKGYTFKIKTPLSKQEQAQEKAAVTDAVNKSMGLKQTFLGGITQGLTLGTADAFGEDTENLRLRQEEENPFTYNVGKLIGSLAPSGALVAGGAALGSPFGPGGVLLGGMGGAALAGGIESYASKPTPPEGKGFPSGGDAAMAVASGLTEGVATKAAPMVRGAYRTARNKLTGNVVAGATEVAEGVASEAAGKLNKLNAALQKIESNIQFKKGEKIMNMSEEDIFDRIDSIDDYDDVLQLKKQLADAVKGLGGTDKSSMNVIKEVLTKQYNDAAMKAAKSTTSAMVGGAGAAVPMAVPDADLSQGELEKLNKAAIEQAFYNMQRSKLGSAKQ